MNIDMYMPVQIVSGRGVLTDKAALLKRFGKKCMIVTGKTAAGQSGALDDLIKALESQEIAYEVYPKIKENPTTSSCYRAGEAARECGAKFLVGIGGGSVMDAAKAIALYTSHPELRDDSVYHRTYELNHIPVVLIGTTAGTGSEVTGVSVLTNCEGHKKSIKGHDCYASLAYCDPAYTFSLPYDITVSTALDAMAHATEGLFASTCSDYTRFIALRAIKTLWSELRRLSVSGTLPDEASRERIYYASIYAGLVINITGTCFPHTVGYVLTEDYGVPHGCACAAFTPTLMERAAKYDSEMFVDFYKVTGVTPEDYLAVIKKLTGPLAHIDESEAAGYKSRFEGDIGNFDRTPGGFTADDAVDVLAGL